MSAAEQGHFSPVDGRWVSHVRRVRDGRYTSDGHPIYVIPPADKLMSRVVQVDTGCWEWTGPVNNKGYGTCRILGERYAHRASWTLANGPIPDGLVVCHKCDNPRCVNPEHMWLGTLVDNNRDMFAKGRGGGQFQPGHRNPRRRSA